VLLIKRIELPNLAKFVKAFLCFKSEEEEGTITIIMSIAAQLLYFTHKIAVATPASFVLQFRIVAL
jgi:hypothetical protein